MAIWRASVPATEEHRVRCRCSWELQSYLVEEQILLGAHVLPDPRMVSGSRILHAAAQPHSSGSRMPTRLHNSCQAENAIRRIVATRSFSVSDVVYRLRFLCQAGPTHRKNPASDQSSAPQHIGFDAPLERQTRQPCWYILSVRKPSRGRTF